MTMREKMARAMYDADAALKGEMHLMKKKPWEQLHSSTRARYLYDADAALDALYEATKGMYDEADTGGDCNERPIWEDMIRAEKAERERDEALADRDKWRALEREAAHYCEIPIAMRTNFTGDPPYVGWKGLGLAMTQAFDERDAALAALKHTVKES